MRNLTLCLMCSGLLASMPVPGAEKGLAPSFAQGAEAERQRVSEYEERRMEKTGLRVAADQTEGWPASDGESLKALIEEAAKAVVEESRAVGLADLDARTTQSKPGGLRRAIELIAVVGVAILVYLLIRAEP